MREWPLDLESMTHFKFQGANPTSRRPRNIPGLGVTVSDKLLIWRFQICSFLNALHWEPPRAPYVFYQGVQSVLEGGMGSPGTGFVKACAEWKTD